MNRASHSIGYRRGVYFAFAAALISGFSVYINKFALTSVGDPFVFTSAKNVAVAVLLAAILLAFRAIPQIMRLSIRQWFMLVSVGCVGGSVPFLLFFYGLSQGTAAGAGFIHKTLFLWVAIIAVFVLKERLGRWHLAALALLAGGNFLLLGWPANWMGGGELFMLAATVLWAMEAVIARKAMADISANVAAFGRMFFGAVVMLGYLGIAGKLGTVSTLDASQAGWIAITALFLLGYVTCYYSGLKLAPASLVTSVLVMGSVITSSLYAVFDARRYTTEEIMGMVMITGVVIAIGFVTHRIALPVHKNTVPGRI